MRPRQLTVALATSVALLLPGGSRPGPVPELRRSV